MAKYRKKPVVIEAWQWRPFAKGNDIPHWLIMADYELDPSNNTLFIKTLEGTMRADPDDWIIKGVKGEIYPCKPDIFAATYEPVDD